MREPLAKSLIRAVETGEREYSVFKDKRLETKSIKLFDTIQNVKLEEKQCSAKKPPVNKERYHSFAPSILQGSGNMTCKNYFSMRSQAVHST